MKEIDCKMKLRLREARNADAEYQARWTSIPREVFDKIIALDPKTDISKGVVGDTAKRLLLPKYVAGETEFLNNSELPALITKYINNRNAYNIKNVAQFPSVQVFMDYVENPEGTSVEETPEESKTSPIDFIYNQFYSDIPRKNFNSMIILDPTTNLEKGVVGAYAKQLLLPLLRKQLAGDVGALAGYSDEQISRTIEDFEDIKKKLPPEARVLSNYKTFEDFYNTTQNGNPSDFLNYVKQSGILESGDARYIGSTALYDVFEALTCYGDAILAGADPAVGGPGLDQDKTSSGHLSNAYGHWCTSSSSSTFTSTSYKGSDKSNKYYVFIYRDNPRADDRAHNYQLAVQRDGLIKMAATGEEKAEFGNKYALELFGKDPTLIPLLAQEEGWLGNYPQVKIYKKVKGQKHWKIPSLEALNTLKEDPDWNILKTFMQIITVEAPVDNLPLAAFAGCSALREVILPESLKNIGPQAFKNCISLSKVIFPEGLESIGAQAFMNCASLRGIIRIPNSVKTIGLNAFKNTRATLYIRKDRAVRSLKIDPADRQWFIDSVQVTNESFNTLEEDFLDENLPRDLAAAYTAQKTTRGTSNLQHNDEQKGMMGLRRGSRIDFYNATYEPVSAETAAVRVRATPSNVDHIRAIYGNDFLELDLRANNKVYPVVLPELDNKKFVRSLQAVGAPANEDKVRDWLRHKVQSNVGLRTVLSAADKIYWTDEYEHMIDDDSDIARKRDANKETATYYLYPSRASRTDDNAPNADLILDKDKAARLTLPKVADTGSHEGNRWGLPLDFADIGVRGYSDQAGWQQVPWGGSKPRTVAEFDTTTDGLNNAMSFISKRKVLLRAYQSAQKALKKLQDNRTDYDEAEYSQLKDMLEDRAATLGTLIQRYDKYIRAARDHVVLQYNAYMLNINNKIREQSNKLAALRQKAEEMNKQLRALKTKLAGEESKVASAGASDVEYAQVLKGTQAQLRRAQESMTEVENDIAEAEADMRRLQERIENRRKSLKLYNNRIELLQEIQNALDSDKGAGVEVAIKENSAKTAAIEKDILEIQNWFNNTKGSGKRFAIKPHKETNPELDALLDMGDAEDGEAGNADTGMHGFSELTALLDKIQECHDVAMAANNTDEPDRRVVEAWITLSHYIEEVCEAVRDRTDPDVRIPRDKRDPAKLVYNPFYDYEQDRPISYEEALRRTYCVEGFLTVVAKYFKSITAATTKALKIQSDILNKNAEESSSETPPTNDN